MPDHQMVSSLLCRRCEYNLHGLPLRGDCPECGCAIRDSYDRWFHRPPRDILQRVAIGALLCALGLAGPTLAVGLGLVSGKVNLVSITLAVTLACYTLGAWLISAYLGSRSASHLMAERRLLRLTIAAFIVSTSVITFATIGAAAFPLIPGGMITALIFLAGAAFSLLGLALWFSLILTLDLFAARAINSSRAATLCRCSLLGLPFLLGVLPFLVLSGYWTAAFAALLLPLLYNAGAFLAISLKTSRLLRS